MDEQEEMKTVSSSDESEETDEEVEMERMAQQALMEKEKVSYSIWCKMKTGQMDNASWHKFAKSELF